MIDETTQLLIAAYHDGELTEPQRSQVERLVEQDAGAAAELAALRELSAAMSAVARPAIDPALLASLHRQIDREDPVLARLTGWLTTAAAAVFLVCSGLLLSQLSNQARAGSPDPLIEGMTLMQTPLQSAADQFGPAPEVQLTQWIVADLSMTGDAGLGPGPGARRQR